MAFLRWLYAYLRDWTWTLRRTEIRVRLGFNSRKDFFMNRQWDELAEKGISIDLKDKGGNVIDPANYPKPGDVTANFACSDPTVVTFPPSDPANPYASTGISTGVVAKDLFLTFTLNFNSGAPSITGKSELFDVPAGPPASADVFIGPDPTPAP